MKKLFILSFALCAFTFTSCKKDFTCTCTTTSPGSASTSVKKTVKDVTKKQAEALCNSGDQTVTVGGFGFTQTQSCKID
jgi:hypothetical protein